MTLIQFSPVLPLPESFGDTMPNHSHLRQALEYMYSGTCTRRHIEGSQRHNRCVEGVKGCGGSLSKI